MNALFVASAAIGGAFGPAARVAGDGPAGAWGAALMCFGAIVLAAALRATSDRRLTFVIIVNVATVIGSIAIVPLIGRAPWLFTVAGVVISTIALTPDRPPALLCLPLLAAAQLTWIRTGTNSFMVLLLASAAVVLAIQRFGGQRARDLDVGLRRGGLKVAEIVGVAALLLVALPTLYLPGLLVRVVELLVHPFRRWNDARSSWQSNDVPAAAVRRDATHVFASTRQTVQLRRSMIGIGLIGALALGTWLAVRAEAVDSDNDASSIPTSAPAGTPRPDIADALARIEEVPFSKRPAFTDAPWADDLQAELARIRLEPDDRGSYHIVDFAGTFTNVHGGERVSLTPACRCPRVNVWLIGGSAAFGMGQRDAHTIASELVRLGVSDGVAIDMHNIAVPGWTLWQEYLAVKDKLNGGAEPPDLMVFYDGYNDTIGTIVQKALGGGDPSTPTVMDSDEITRFARSGIQIQSVGGGPVALGQLAAVRYRNIRDEIATLISRSGIDSRFFFQPDALTVPAQRVPIDVLYEQVPQLHQFDEVDRALESSATALEPEVINLRHIFDRESEPVFHDTVHTNEAGALKSANAIYPEIRSLIIGKAK